LSDEVYNPTFLRHKTLIVTVSLRLFLQLLGVISVMVVRAPGQEVVKADPAATTPDLALLPKPSAWTGWGSVFAGVGYRDNILLSHSGEQRSSFLRGGVDATALNTSGGRLGFWTALRASGTRYFSAQEIVNRSGERETHDREKQAILLSQASYRVNDAFKATLDGNAYYSHLIYDVAETDSGVPDVSEVKRSGIALGPTIRWTLHRWWWIEAQGMARRDVYPDGYNNRRSLDGSLRFAWTPGKRFEASLAGTEARRHYDVRKAYNVVGLPIDGTLLEIVEREAELRLKATLDAAAHWQTTTRASITHFADNGAGFLEYHERKLRQDVDWTSGGWHAEFESGARRLEYARQTVGLGNPPPRIRDAFFVRLMIERALTPRWTVYTEYNWERNRCNDPVASYSLNEGLLGLRWNWEK